MTNEDFIKNSLKKIIEEVKVDCNAEIIENYLIEISSKVDIITKDNAKLKEIKYKLEDEITSLQENINSLNYNRLDLFKRIKDMRKNTYEETE